MLECDLDRLPFCPTMIPPRCAWGRLAPQGSWPACSPTGSSAPKFEADNLVRELVDVDRVMGHTCHGGRERIRRRHRNHVRCPAAWSRTAESPGSDRRHALSARRTSAAQRALRLSPAAPFKNCRLVISISLLLSKAIVEALFPDKKGENAEQKPNPNFSGSK